jgi:hypothetical protein
MGGKGRPARKADKLTAICEPIIYKMWEPQHLTTLRASTVGYRDSFTLLYLERCIQTLCRSTVDRWTYGELERTQKETVVV